VVAIIMKREPILQMTGRDRNRMALQSDLLSASVLGIDNVLCLTGDHITMGDHKNAKPVHDLESVQILRALRTLEAGQDLSGNALKGSPKFCAGAVVTPEADPIEPQLLKFEKKIRPERSSFRPKQSMIWTPSSASCTTPANSTSRSWPALCCWFRHAWRAT
jgi:5,10-methylenetetrahydrofolate reductase